MNSCDSLTAAATDATVARVSAACSSSEATTCGDSDAPSPWVRRTSSFTISKWLLK
jgi:hypothetical protein